MDELILTYTTQGYQITFRPAPFECINVEMRFKQFHVTALLNVEAVRHTVAMKHFFAEAERKIIKSIQNHIPVHEAGKN